VRTIDEQIDSQTHGVDGGEGEEQCWPGSLPIGLLFTPTTTRGNNSGRRRGRRYLLYPLISPSLHPTPFYDVDYEFGGGGDELACGRAQSTTQPQGTTHRYWLICGIVRSERMFSLQGDTSRS
jgi:hypothetical protein